MRQKAMNKEGSRELGEDMAAQYMVGEIENNEDLKLAYQRRNGFVKTIRKRKAFPSVPKRSRDESFVPLSYRQVRSGTNHRALLICRS